ncbi:hypothetical protein AX15_001524 [Amanita polypyramis BW_CC]|nr:hypothetical protein AX15_001524 [Amanita polypyramis BW_CC]
MSLTKKDIRRVARRTVEAIEEGGYTCCLFGSAACSVWGMSRVPGDIDIVVFGASDPEVIKADLAEQNPRFYLEDAQDPRNTYKKLFFALCWTPHLCCKIDILVSGPRSSLKIPRIPTHQVQYVGGFNIPVMPFLVLLILKVQGWCHDRDSRRPDRRAKVPQDECDIDELLSMADDDDNLAEFTWLPRWFVDHARNLIEMYVDMHPDTAFAFMCMGFDT